MPFGRLATAAVGTVGVAAAALATSLAIPGSTKSVQPASTRIPAHSTLQMTPTAVGTGGGNVSVTVPRVPPHAVINHLCRDLTEGRKAEPSVWLPDLVAVTGGTTTATTSWCRTYFAITQSR